MTEPAQSEAGVPAVSGGPRILPVHVEEWTLRRQWFTSKSTVGVLSMAGHGECFVLEDVTRNGPKVFGETAIPQGRYQILFTFSPRFKRELPLLVDVKGFSGIRIHAGNFPRDTEGCLLVGDRRAEDAVYNSKATLARVVAEVKRAVAVGELWLTISEDRRS